MRRLTLLLSVLLCLASGARLAQAGEPAPAAPAASSPAPAAPQSAAAPADDDSPGSAAASGAPDELMPFGLRLECEAGYGGYALPIADAALARHWTVSTHNGDTSDWAAHGLMAYQLAYDYSVVPVHIHLEHRMAVAFSGTVEIESRHGYASAEAPDGSPPTYVRRSFTAPPSVPLDFTLAPRCAPPSRPGGPVRLRIRIWQHGVRAPVYDEERTVTQLEPAHLYSLLLDGPADAAPQADELNPGNRLQLAIPAQHGHAIDPAVYSSTHYLLSCPRAAVTGQPLAARQFAFVVAGWPALQQWPPGEQAALAAFAVGGGRLCLYDVPAGAQWQGCRLDAAQGLGRGWLVPVAGGPAAAQHAIHDWLEGELTEFALLAGGSAGRNANGTPRRLPLGAYTGLGTSGLELLQVYGLPDAAADPVSAALPLAQRRGFLHPLWLYREAADGAAVEPWDFPEFTRYPLQPSRANLNIGRVTNLEHSAQAPEPLSSFATGARRLPPGWLPGSIALALLPLLAIGAVRWRRPARLGLGLVALTAAAAGAGAWSQARPSPRPLARQQLFDVDARCPVACEREAAGRFASGSTGPEIPLPADALLRRVDWQPAGAWDWDSAAQVTGPGDGPGTWRGRGTGGYAVLRSDSVLTTTATWPVRAQCVRLGPQALEMTVESAGLPPGTPLLLQTALGWDVLRASPQPQRVSLALPVLPLQPGWERLRAEAQIYTDWNQSRFRGPDDFPPGQSLNELPSHASDILLAEVLSGTWPPGLPRHPANPADPAEQVRLGWAALLQNPLYSRGLPAGAGILYAPLTQPATAPAAGAGTASPPLAQCSWLRYSFPLDGAPSTAGAAP